MGLFVQDVLKKAIKDEEKSLKFYAKLSEKIRHYNCKILFERLATEEMKHKAFLEDLLARSSYLMRRQMEERGDIDFTPNFNISKHFDPTFDTTGLKESFFKAIKLEQKSIEEYKRSAVKTKDEDKKFIFERLASFEKMHEDLLRAEYNKLFSML